MSVLVYKIKPVIFISILGITILLTSCTSPQPTSAPSPVSTQASSPMATPVGLARLTPKAGMGSITGRLVAGSVTGPAYVGGDLYLGRLIAGSDPKAKPLVAFSNDVDPKTDVNPSDGQFDFTDVKPGNYALVIWNPTNSFVVELPNGGGMVQVKVEPDKVIDLGTIVIP